MHALPPADAVLAARVSVYVVFAACAPGGACICQLIHSVPPVDAVFAAGVSVYAVLAARASR